MLKRIIGLSVIVWRGVMLYQRGCHQTTVSTCESTCKYMLFYSLLCILLWSAH